MQHSCQQNAARRLLLETEYKINKNNINGEWLGHSPVNSLELLIN